MVGTPRFGEIKRLKGRMPNLDPDAPVPLTAAPVTPHQIIAADMNADGKFTESDPGAILRAGLSGQVAFQSSLVVMDEATDLSRVSLAETRRNSNPLIVAEIAMPSHWVAVLRGDIDGSWVSVQ